MIFAGLGHGELFLLSGQYHRAVFHRRGVTAVLYLVVFGPWIGYTAYIWLLKHVSTPKVATYTYVKPIVAVFLGWLMLHAQFDRCIQAGSIVIVCRGPAGDDSKSPFRRRFAAHRRRTADT